MREMGIGTRSVPWSVPNGLAAYMNEMQIADFGHILEAPWTIFVEFWTLEAF